MHYEHILSRAVQHCNVRVASVRQGNGHGMLNAELNDVNQRHLYVWGSEDAFKQFLIQLISFIGDGYINVVYKSYNYNCI